MSWTNRILPHLIWMLLKLNLQQIIFFYLVECRKKNPNTSKEPFRAQLLKRTIDLDQNYQKINLKGRIDSIAESYVRLWLIHNWWPEIYVAMGNSSINRTTYNNDCIERTKRRKWHSKKKHRIMGEKKRDACIFCNLFFFVSFVIVRIDE